MKELPEKTWHALSAEESVESLQTDAKRGLTREEAARRREAFGPNAVPPHGGAGPLWRFLLQFHQPLIYILLGAAIVTLALQEYVDSAVIMGVVLVNAIVGFVQESKAAKALDALAHSMTTHATIVREGDKHEVDSDELVPGDVVFLQSGDKVPADLRLIHHRDLQVDESTLTGESVPSSKATDPMEADTSLADRSNMAYSASLVTYGQATGVVVATGLKTEVGRITEMVSMAEELATPLTRQITRFSHLLLYVIMGLAAFTLAVGVWRGDPWIDTFMAAVALAVAAIPEGLPAAMTITLAIGVGRMARRRAIIRNLPAVETLGSTTVICSDKTGTLTENQMTVRRIVAGGHVYDVSGGGYGAEGEIAPASEQAPGPSENRALDECLRAGLLCNDSEIEVHDGKPQVRGDPTEGALIVSAAKAGLSEDQLAKETPRLDLVPFESEYKYMATLHDGGQGQPRAIYLKGALEAVLPKCRQSLDAAGEPQTLDAESVERTFEEMAANGLRVLAFARGERPADADQLAHEHLAEGLTFLGLQGMIDPARAEVVEAVRQCQRAGIRVKMITGDHALTAAAIARDVGLGDQRPETLPEVLSGRDLEALAEKDLSDAVERVSVFARVSPEQKLILIRALQGRDHIVAMTGDGVNDAPALKQADIGVAMGITGTEAAKEAADMVLTDDNFASIEAAVEEGRGVFDNLTKFLVWTLPTSLGEALVVLAAIVAGLTLPILPLQILWINMTTAVLLGLGLAFELKEPDVMSRQPRDPRASILTGTLLGRIVLVGGLLLVMAFGFFQWALYRGASLDQARTIAVCVFIFVEMFYLFNCRSLTGTVSQIGFFSNVWILVGAAIMLVLQLLFTYLPLMNRLFHSAPIGWEHWAWIIGASLFTYVVVEIEKWLRRRSAAGSHDPHQSSGD
jgi:Ca2+-transporting ATPase